MRKQSKELQGRGKAFRASAMTMLSNGGASGRPYTDEKGRDKFDVDRASIKDPRADLSSKGEGFVRIQQESSRVGGFGTQAAMTNMSSKR